jgi:uncharacterized protein (TIGR00255 family)
MKPVASMTGYAVVSRSSPVGTIAIELKSVNSRFLDLALRVADELRAAEPAVREAIAAALARGKVECRLSLRRDAVAQPARLNTAALAELDALAGQVRAALPEAAPLTISDALAWPGVIEAQEADTEALRSCVLAALDEALAALLQTRQREGEALKDVLLARCDDVDAIAGRLAERVPDMLAAQERKLNERLNQALGPALTGLALPREEVADRIRQEVTLYGLRADVDEELKRLTTHIREVRRLLAAGGAAGRRLDFLMQELNREANTLGSKATSIELSHASVELKLAIEQMREQIQNLE